MTSENFHLEKKFLGLSFSFVSFIVLRKVTAFLVNYFNVWLDISSNPGDTFFGCCKSDTYDITYVFHMAFDLAFV